jgi:hypothetical protein
MHTLGSVAMQQTSGAQSAAAGAEKAAEPPQSKRSFVPRRGLPTGRALIGALLTTVAAVGAFAVATSADRGPTTEFLVLINDVEPGSGVELTDVRLAAMTLTAGVESAALRTTAGLEGATALRLLRAGSILDGRDLNGAAFVDGEPVTGVHELTIPVARDRAPVQLSRGDRVTVLAFDERNAVLRTALEDALVLSYDTESAGIGSSGEGRLTLALPDADLVVRGALWSYASLTVVLTSRAIDDDYVDEYAADSG